MWTNVSSIQFSIKLAGRDIAVAFIHLVREAKERSRLAIVIKEFSQHVVAETSIPSSSFNR